MHLGSPRDIGVALFLPTFRAPGPPNGDLFGGALHLFNPGDESVGASFAEPFAGRSIFIPGVTKTEEAGSADGCKLVRRGR